MGAYLEDLTTRLWDYQREYYPNVEEYFERTQSDLRRPPIFMKDKAGDNVLHRRGAPPEEVAHLEALLPTRERHRWFRSMKSSQALVQSVFGNLILSGEIGELNDVLDDDGQKAFGGAVMSPSSVKLEHSVKHLGEPRGTSIDVFVEGHHRVAVECKLSESDIGRCSRPAIRPTQRRYSTDHCDGGYRRQRGRENRCSLSEIGVKYWDLVPRVLSWDNERDWDVCPLLDSYQLVRNILAVCVKEDGTVASDEAHVLLVYDQRNPAFQRGGKALAAFTKTHDALLDPGVLRRCSWQRLIGHLRLKSVLPWLTEALAAKYGL